MMERGVKLNGADHLRAQTHWVATGDPTFPLKSSVNGETWTIRINEFPDEYLYTLIINGQEDQSFDDWPEPWQRSQSPTRNPYPLSESQAAEDLDRLTVREIEILSLIGDGRGNQQIADRLLISRETVRWHVKSLSAKLGNLSRRGLRDHAALLQRLGRVMPEINERKKTG